MPFCAQLLEQHLEQHLAPTEALNSGTWGVQKELALPCLLGEVDAVVAEDPVAGTARPKAQRLPLSYPTPAHSPGSLWPPKALLREAEGP